MKDKFSLGDEARIAQDPYGVHEAMHMASVLADMVGDHLADHPAVKLRPEIRNMVQEAIASLCNAYQALGNVDREL